MTEPVVEILTRCDEEAALRGIAEALVSRRLAACAHVRGPVESLYRWKGVVTRADEWELDAVTTIEGVGAARALIADMHPYETPAILTRVCEATAAYAAWVRAETL